MADCTPTMDIECELQHSPIVNGMKAKEQQLQMQVNRINDTINKNVIWPVGEKWIKQRLDDIEASVEDANDRVDQQNTVISEIGDNIALLKGMSTRQDEKISSLQKNVIADETYFNFEDWVENVYIPQWSAPANKYSQGDIYMNVNPDVAATNATYVCIRPVDSTAPLSANDWQQMYYSAPADVMAILGIDPIKVTHPYKHEWVISVDPNRLADMIWGLRTLDLSSVEVTLWEVYFEPVIKESATIQENLTVWNTTTTKELDAEVAYIDRACIRELSCDTDFPGTPTFGTINVDNIIANNYHQEWGEFVINNANVTITWGTVNIPAIEWDTYFGDDVYAPNINITNKITTEYVDVHNDAHFDGYVTIDWYLKYIDPTDPEHKIICIDNAIKNLYRPSFWMFDVGWSWQTWTSDWNNVVFWFWSDCIWVFNAIENRKHPSPADQVKLISVTDQSHNNTWVKRDESFTTPWVELVRDEVLDPIFKWPVIRINWHNWQDSWIYRIEFNMTIELNDLWNLPMNVFAHRWWIVCFDYDKLNEWVENAFYIIDDKTSTQLPLWTFDWDHLHQYNDRNDWEDSSGSRSNVNTHANPHLQIKNPSDHRCDLQPDWWFSEVVYRVWNHYTYTKTLMVPVLSKFYVAPFFKPSAWCVWKDVHVSFSIPEWNWQTWSKAQIFVQKIADIKDRDNPAPYEYYC